MHSRGLLISALPDISGREATHRMRQMPNISGIPMLVLTAHVTEGKQECITDSGVDDVLTKPINDDLLVKALHKYLQG